MTLNGLKTNTKPITKKRAYVIVGSNFGDEGKGLSALHFAKKNSDTKVLNILTNGGPQRGHTIEIEESNYRHECSHIGAGTFAEADNYFCEDFLVGPQYFITELQDIWQQGYGCYTEFFINPNCKVLTPYDSFINQIVESARQKTNSHHGSCGYGIRECQLRYQNSKFNHFYHTLINMTDNEIMQYLSDIAFEYVPTRLQEMGIDPKTLPLEMVEKLTSSDIAYAWLTDLRKMQAKCKETDWNTLANEYDTFIFENGQGLCLDQDNQKEFPHLTPSKTGCYIAKKHLESLTYPVKTNLCYISRTYLTRHGAGNLKDECQKQDIPNTAIGYDKTNHPNEWQGTLRYAPLDTDSMFEYINMDKSQLPNAKTTFILTHTNEANDILLTELTTKLENRFDNILFSNNPYTIND